MSSFSMFSFQLNSSYHHHLHHHRRGLLCESHCTTRSHHVLMSNKPAKQFSRELYGIFCVDQVCAVQSFSFYAPSLERELGLPHEMDAYGGLTSCFSLVSFPVSEGSKRLKQSCEAQPDSSFSLIQHHFLSYNLDFKRVTGTVWIWTERTIQQHKDWEAEFTVTALRKTIFRGEPLS